jgi:hypothetical protein
VNDDSVLQRIVSDATKRRPTGKHIVTTPATFGNDENTHAQGCLQLASQATASGDLQRAPSRQVLEHHAKLDIGSSLYYICGPCPMCLGRITDSFTRMYSTTTTLLAKLKFTRPNNYTTLLLHYYYYYYYYYY